jgi:N-carbamoylputrescine amidase
MKVDVHNKENNLKAAEEAIDRAVEEHKAELIVFPEFFTSVYFAQWMDRKYFSLAEKIPGPSTQKISQKANQHGVFVAAPVFEEVMPGEYYDSSALIGPDGRVVSVYRKIHRDDTQYPEGGLFSYEKFYFRPGNRLDVVEARNCRLGQLICYDRHFPEAWRILALKGAELIIIPIASMGAHLESHNVIEGRVLAYLNQVFVACVNRVGQESDLHFYGGSYIAAPDGRLLAGPAGNDPEIISASLDLEEIKVTRHEFQLYRDRRPDVYGPIAEKMPISKAP